MDLKLTLVQKLLRGIMKDLGESSGMYFMTLMNIMNRLYKPKRVKCNFFKLISDDEHLCALLWCCKYVWN